MAAPQKNMNGLRKAAALMICLGEDSAANILHELTNEEAYKLTRSMAQIIHIPKEIRNMVLEDFERDKTEYEGLVVKGHEFAKAAIKKSGDREQVQRLMEQFISGTESRPLETIATLSPTIVAGILEHEHPQTVALILSTQTPEHASAIISKLPEENQSDVVYRIATTETVDPDIILKIEDALKKEIGTTKEHEHHDFGGIDKAVEILYRMENNLDTDILDNMEDIDQDLTEEIRKKMFTFEDLVSLDGRSLQMILREVNNDSLTMGLKTASDELKEKIFANMSIRAADMIRDDLEAMGPVRLSEVETMQQTIVKIATKLEDEGKLILRKGSGDELV